MNIEILYPYILYTGIPIVFLSSIWRLLYHKKPVYIYTATKPIQNTNNKKWHEIILFLLRLFSLLILVIGACRLRKPDTRSKVPVNGIDIMLAMDVSGSMTNLYENNSKTRFDVAKEEAIKFIEKRENDSIGLVLFANVAVSRCPLTQDKKFLKNIILDTTIGQINFEGTVLSKGLLTAINRLKYSNAKSKIIILLTDGDPTSNDERPEKAIELARKLGIKIYTIGIGDDKPFDIFTFFGHRITPPINTRLLNNIASNTGGSSFLAKEPKELENIYNEIDQLEKTEYQAPIYSKYFEYFMLLLWITFALICLEILLSTLVWPSLN